MNRNGAFFILIVLLAIFGGILYWSINQPAELVTTSSSIEKIVTTGEEIHWNAYKITSPSVLVENGTQQLWYVGNGAVSRSGIGYATAPQGTNEWSIETTDIPLLTGSQAWENGGIRSAEVDKVSNYILWYSADNAATHVRSIGIAVSDDGKRWIKQANNPAIIPTPDAWYSNGVDNPSVVYKDGTYHMLFTGTKNDDTTAIGYASSTDRSSWNIYPSPVFEGQAEWNSYSVSEPHILYIGNGLYEMWFSGQQEKNGYTAFGRAYSNNPTLWIEDTNVNPMVAQTNKSMKESFVIPDGSAYQVFASVIDRKDTEEPLYTTIWPE